MISRSPLTERARTIIERATRADGTPPISDQALLAVAQGKRRLFDFEHTVGIVGEGELDLVVDPEARGRGIGREALRSLLSHEDRRAPTALRAWAHGQNPAAEALLRGEGFAPVRLLLRMTLDPTRLAAALAQSRELPDGFAVVAYEPGNDAQADDWVRVNAAAFADHPEQGAMTRTDFDALTREPWFDADDLRLAYTTGEGEAAPGGLAGFAWVKTTTDDEGESPGASETIDETAGGAAAEAGATPGRVETELYALGVDPAFAGIGLGAALLGETLRQMSTHSPDRITLYVDGDNTNAVALYERAGFEIEQRSTQYLRAAQGR